MSRVNKAAGTDQTRSRLGPTDAFRLARHTFMAGDRIDMQDLAAELKIDRTTLFRWVGNRDTLVVEILTSLADPTIRAIAEDAEGVGGRRIANIAAAYTQTLIDSDYYRAFLQREAEKALKLITTKASPLQQHVVQKFERLLEQESDRGNLSHPMNLHDLAYLIVRIIESFTYADIITGDDPDSAKVAAAIAALLHADLDV